MIERPLARLKADARNEFHNSTITEDWFYDRINTHTYLCASDLVLCVKDIIAEWEEMNVDMDYLYGEYLISNRLQTVVATYMDWYIREKARLWWAKLDDDLKIEDSSDNF